MPTRKEYLNLEAEINAQKAVAQNVLAKLVLEEPINNADVSEMVNAIVEAAFLTTSAHYLSWHEDIPGESPSPMKRVPYSTEFVPVEEETTDISLGFAINIDEAITLKVGWASAHDDGDYSVDIEIDGSEASVALSSLKAVIKELERLSKIYYPIEEDDATPVQASAEVQS